VRALGWVAATWLLTLGIACEPVTRPNRFLPENFKARILDGQRLDRASLTGKPWVIKLWVPG
jgi:hypothetical protein